MDTITITLVRTLDGRLIGRTASDRWNLATVLGPHYTLYADRNGTAVKQLRRRLAREFGTAFRIVQRRGHGQIIHSASRREAEALGPAVASVVPPEYLPLYAKL